MHCLEQIGNGHAANWKEERSCNHEASWMTLALTYLIAETRKNWMFSKQLVEKDMIGKGEECYPRLRGFQIHISC